MFVTDRRTEPKILFGSKPVEPKLVRQECERQKCERHQCEANSANANSAKGSTVRMRQECECQQCECQQCDATLVRKKCDSSANANSANRIFFFFTYWKIQQQSSSSSKNITWECKHCGASLGRHDPFSSMETKSCLFEEMSPISGYFPSNARWRSEGKGRSREDEMAMLPRVLTCPFRRRGFNSSHWLFSQCFRAPSPNTVERSQSINGHQNWKLKRNFGRQSSISCVSKMGKEGQNACRKI